MGAPPLCLGLLANTLLKEKRLFIDPFQISHKKDYTTWKLDLDKQYFV